MTVSPRIEDLLEGLKKHPGVESCVSARRFVPAREAEYASITVREEILRVLRQDGIEDLYTHQAAAITEVRQGRNVVVMTPTASGKSLVYNIPVIEAVLEDPEAKALYLFPLKGLEQDQVKNLDSFLRRCISAGSVDTSPPGKGATQPAQRRRRRASPC